MRKISRPPKASLGRKDAVARGFKRAEAEKVRKTTMKLSEKQYRYNLESSYEDNFVQAYRKLVDPAASVQECHRLSERGLHLAIRMDQVNFFKGYLPVAAIDPKYRDKLQGGARYPRVYYMSHERALKACYDATLSDSSSAVALQAEDKVKSEEDPEMEQFQAVNIKPVPAVARGDSTREVTSSSLARVSSLSNASKALRGAKFDAQRKGAKTQA